MLTAIIFLAVLALLVIAHELGHFITARKSGMKVYEFGFGFPPRAFGFQVLTKKDENGKLKKKKIFFWGRGEIKEEEQKEENFAHKGWELGTIYSFNWLPLGGFVRIKGEDGESKNEKDSFGHQKAWKRIIVLSAGVVMNFLLAGVLLGIGFMVGLPMDTSSGIEDSAIVVGEPATLIQYVEKGSPADEVGLKFGDQVLMIGEDEVTSANQVVNYIQANSQGEIILKVKRENQELNFVATPRVLKNGDETPRLGMMLADAGLVRYPWYISLYKGFVAAGVGLVNVFIGLFLMIKSLIIGKGLISDVSGPIGIAVIVGQSAKMGFNYLINVTAMISLSLAALNILPIPALDGGRILFIIIEKIIRRPVNEKYERLAHLIGFALLMALIIFVTFRDIFGLIK